MKADVKEAELWYLQTSSAADELSGPEQVTLESPMPYLFLLFVCLFVCFKFYFIFKLYILVLVLPSLRCLILKEVLGSSSRQPPPPPQVAVKVKAVNCH